MIMVVVVVVVVVVVIASFSDATELRESTILEIEGRRKGFEVKYGRMEGLIENRLGKRVNSEASSVTRKRVQFCGADWIREGFHFVWRGLGPLWLGLLKPWSSSTNEERERDGCGVWCSRSRRYSVYSVFWLNWPGTSLGRCYDIHTSLCAHLLARGLFGNVCFTEESVVNSLLNFILSYQNCPHCLKSFIIRFLKKRKKTFIIPLFLAQKYYRRECDKGWMVKRKNCKSICNC